MSPNRKSATQQPRTSGPLELSEFAQIAYSELRRLAGNYFKHERADHTLQPTALVHEVYIRLASGGPETYVNRAHFFSTAARAMRQILVDYARAHNAKKRSGRTLQVALDALEAPTLELPDYPAIDAALTRLATVHRPQLAQIAEMRIFAGLSTDEVADTLGLAPASVRVYWSRARAFLEKQLQKS
jgi:RNA polymerase sigma factor (TIGR02999 family)